MPRINEDICRILGIMHGDGNMSYSRILITDKCREYHESVIHPLFLRAFGVKMNLFHDKNRNSFYSHTKKKTLYNYFVKNLLIPQGSVRKGLKVPKYAYKFTCKQKNAYISGLFDSESYVSNRQAQIDFTTTSKDLHEFVASHIISLGIDISQFSRKRRKNREYEIRIYGKKRLSLLTKSLILKHPDKIKRLEKFLSH